MIDLHFCPTPNGWKIVIMLEETGLPYNVIPYDIFQGEHLKPEFAAINPNHKIPAIVDQDPIGGGAPFPVFESGAILIYLAEKTGQFMPSDPLGRSLVLQWLVWQVAGLGPMYGQLNHFGRYAPPPQEYAHTRYLKESERLTQVLENRLRVSEFLAGEYSIADMAVLPWVMGTKMFGIDLEQFPSVTRWLQTLSERPAVQSAYSKKATEPNPKYMQEKAKLNDEEWSNAFGEKQMASVRVG
ncbi:GST-like protein [Sphingobium xenophagum]|uniref:GST-like protein n=1 Tax=Sphingobium xenophagum TaxID=121428 RepID=A0ABU1X549_SPHXE|nr:glutathione S-transferase N-terminal domain-containing protein [Sphingobium xenophagum]MDR7156695.1 GST-like protein [Sphingobium xenophagum]